MSGFEIAILVFFFYSFLYFIFLHFRSKRKSDHYRNYLNLIDIGKELKDEIKSFIAKKKQLLNLFS